MSTPAGRPNIVGRVQLPQTMPHIDRRKENGDKEDTDAQFIRRRRGIRDRQRLQHDGRGVPSRPPGHHGQNSSPRVNGRLAPTSLRQATDGTTELKGAAKPEEGPIQRTISWCSTSHAAAPIRLGETDPEGRASGYPCGSRFFGARRLMPQCLPCNILPPQE